MPLARAFGQPETPASLLACEFNTTTLIMPLPRPLSCSLFHHSCKAPQLHWCCSWSKEGFSPQLPHNTQTHAHINTHSLTIKSSHHRFFATPLCCDWTQSSCWNGAFFNNLCLLSWRAYFLFKCAVRKKVFSSTVILTISICLGLERYKKTMKWFL